MLFSWFERETYPNGRSLVRFGFDIYFPLVQLDTAFHDREAEPCSFYVSHVRAPVVGFINVFHLGFWYAYALVFHGQLNRMVCWLVQGARHRFVPGRILDGIVQEVVENMREQIFV